MKNYKCMWNFYPTLWHENNSVPFMLSFYSLSNRMHIFEDEYFSIFLIFCILQGISLFVHYLIFFFLLRRPHNAYLLLIFQMHLSMCVQILCDRMRILGYCWLRCERLWLELSTMNFCVACGKEFKKSSLVEDPGCAISHCMTSRIFEAFVNFNLHLQNGTMPPPVAVRLGGDDVSRAPFT